MDKKIREMFPFRDGEMTMKCGSSEKLGNKQKQICTLKITDKKTIK